MSSSIILNSFAFKICLWIILGEFGVSYKHSFHSIWFPTNCSLSILGEIMGCCLHLGLNFHSLTDSAVLPVGGAASSELWGGHGLHFLHWPQGGRDRLSDPQSMRIPLRTWLRAAESSYVSSGTDWALPSDAPGQHLCRQELSLLRTHQGFGFRTTWGCVHTDRSWVSWRPRWSREEKVRRSEEKWGEASCVRLTVEGGPSSCDPGRAWCGKLGF